MPAEKECTVSEHAAAQRIHIFFLLIFALHQILKENYYRTESIIIIIIIIIIKNYITEYIIIIIIIITLGVSVNQSVQLLRHKLDKLFLSEARGLPPKSLLAALGTIQCTYLHEYLGFFATSKAAGA
jgi:hypothetical protein